MWLLSNLVAAVVMGFIIAALVGPIWLLLTAAVFIGLTLLGLRSSNVQLELYQLWNRAAARVRKAGFRWILFLSHRLLLRAIGSEGSKFDGGADRTGSTGWTSYPVDFRSGSSARQSGQIDEIMWKSWMRHYIEWARDEGNRWALLLLPLLMMLSLFSEGEDNTTTPSNIYTLF